MISDADLQIGKLAWGDSGLYYCVITTPDDLEGKNEDSVELLVLGKRQPPACASTSEGCSVSRGQRSGWVLPAQTNRCSRALFKHRAVLLLPRFWGAGTPCSALPQCCLCFPSFLFFPSFSPSLCTCNPDFSLL